MSVYPQSYYGQPSYSSPAFNTPPPSVQHGHPYQYQGPQSHLQAPVIHADPVAFRRDYSQRLAQLTFNSRPIIQNLSMLAQEYSRFADIVAHCIETHIRRVTPWTKLPAFYLLDAISKNVYEPYARQFASFVIPLFLETYHLVDENTRSKMEEMLLTWRTGSPSGKELFGVAPQIAIERGVWGDGGSHQTVDGFHTGSGQITKSQVLSELQFTLGQKERIVQSNPYDAASQNHVAVLHQLRKLVEAGVSQEELQQILTQLRALARASAPAPPPPPALPQAPPQWQTHSPFPPQPLAVPHVNRTYLPVHQSNIYPSASVKQEAPLGVGLTPSTSSDSADSIANLLSTLVKAGVVSASGTPQGAGTNTEELPRPSSVDPIDLKREALREYRNNILSQPMNLMTSGITRTRPRIVELMYDSLSAQCRQCGIRFPDTALGKKNMENHLDMHFRQNRKANQNVGRGHSRSWFVGLEDWIHDHSEDIKGKGRADSSGRLSSKANAAAEAAKRDAELRTRYVVVPPGDEAKPISCPICKESLKSEFLEEDEDWVWKNAIMKDEKVYHATCHAEALVSTNSLVARLRTELTSGSRGATPEAQLAPNAMIVSRSTPPASTMHKSKSPSLSPSPDSKIAGTKRKADVNDSNVPTEADGTPPLKKVALSTAS